MGGYFTNSWMLPQTLIETCTIITIWVPNALISNNYYVELYGKILQRNNERNIKEHGTSYDKWMYILLLHEWKVECYEYIIVSIAPVLGTENEYLSLGYALVTWLVFSKVIIVGEPDSWGGEFQKSTWPNIIALFCVGIIKRTKMTPPLSTLIKKVQQEKPIK